MIEQTKSTTITQILSLVPPRKISFSPIRAKATGVSFNVSTLYHQWHSWKQFLQFKKLIQKKYTGKKITTAPAWRLPQRLRFTLNGIPREFSLSLLARYCRAEPVVHQYWPDWEYSERSEVHILGKTQILSLVGANPRWAVLEEIFKTI